MRRVFPVVLGLMIGLVVAGMVIEVRAQGSERMSTALNILRLDPGQWQRMSKEERHAFVQALPAETRRELAKLMAARRDSLTPEQRRKGTPVQVPARSGKPKINGLIQYDSGSPAGFYATFSNKGNRFNTALTPGITACTGGPGSCPQVLAPGTITKLSAFVLASPPPTGTGSAMSPARFVVFGAQSGSVVPMLYWEWYGSTPSTGCNPKWYLLAWSTGA